MRNNPDMPRRALLRRPYFGRVILDMSILDMSILDRAAFVVESYFRPNGFSIYHCGQKGRAFKGGCHENCACLRAGNRQRDDGFCPNQYLGEKHGKRPLRHGIKPEQSLRLTTHELERDLRGWALRN
jgi:hypothetical protein